MTGETHTLFCRGCQQNKRYVVARSGVANKTNDMLSPDQGLPTKTNDMLTPNQGLPTKTNDMLSPNQGPQPQSLIAE
jgi:hypothetical protein